VNRARIIAINRPRLLLGLYTERIMPVFGMYMHELGRYARYCSVLLGMLYFALLVAL
jgi:hypothetical protein